MCAIVVIGNHFEVLLLINHAYEICTLDSVKPTCPPCHNAICHVMWKLQWEGKACEFDFSQIGLAYFVAF